MTKKPKQPNPFKKQILILEFNFPQGKKVLRHIMLLSQLSLTENPERYLIQDPFVRNYFVIKFKYVHGQILHPTRLDSQVSWLRQSFYCLLLVGFFIAFTFRSLLAWLELNYRLVLSVSVALQNSVQREHNVNTPKLPDTSSLHSVGPKLTGSNWLSKT